MIYEVLGNGGRKFPHGGGNCVMLDLYPHLTVQRPESGLDEGAPRFNRGTTYDIGPIGGRWYGQRIYGPGPLLEAGSPAELDAAIRAAEGVS